MIESINKKAKELRKEYQFLFGKEFDDRLRKEYGNSDKVIPELKAMQVKVNQAGEVVGDDLGTYVQLEDFALQENKKDKPLNYLFEAKRLKQAGFFNMVDMGVVHPAKDKKVIGFFKRLDDARRDLDDLENDTETTNGQTICKNQHLLSSFPTISLIHTHLLTRIIYKCKPKYMLLCRELDALGIINPLAPPEDIHKRVEHFLCNPLYLKHTHFNLRWGWPTKTEFKKSLKEVVRFVTSDYIPLVLESLNRFGEFELAEVEKEIAKYRVKKEIKKKVKEKRKSKRKLKAVH